MDINDHKYQYIIFSFHFFKAQGSILSLFKKSLILLLVAFCLLLHLKN